MNEEPVSDPYKLPERHWSDCAIYSEPAYPAGECDCGGVPPVKSYCGGKPNYCTDADIAHRKWQGLTDDEIDDVQHTVDCRLYRTYARAIEAKLKEKNEWTCDIYEEGCTPADVRVLREANWRMAQELFELKQGGPEKRGRAKLNAELMNYMKEKI